MKTRRVKPWNLRPLMVSRGDSIIEWIRCYQCNDGKPAWYVLFENEDYEILRESDTLEIVVEKGKK